MYSRIDSSPEYHRQQVNLALAQIDRDIIAEHKHGEWLKDRPGFQLYRGMYRGFHGAESNPFHAIESPLASEAELCHMARMSDEMGGTQ